MKMISGLAFKVWFKHFSLNLKWNKSFFAIFQVRASSQTKGLERGWKQRARLERDAKNTDCPFCTRYIRSNYPLLPATGNFHWLNFDASCQVMFSTTHSQYSVPWWIPKAFALWRCMPGFARAGIGICFKIGAEGNFGVAPQGKGCFLCPANRI